MLNEKQKAGLWLGIAAVVVMGSYPPWKESGPDGNPAAYAPIYSPPPRLEGRPALTVDLSRLLLQWSMVGFVVAGLIATGKQAHKGTDNAGAAFGETAPPTTTQEADNKTSQFKASHLEESLSKETGKGGGAAESLRSVKTITFPEDVSLGDVLVESEDDPDYWEALGQAEGTLAVPWKRRLQLEGHKSGPIDLSNLRAIDGNLFHSIDLSETQVQDEDLVHLSAQTNLHELDLSHTKVTDKGIEHLANLSCVRMLWLDQTKITDCALSTLKSLRNLVKLSLTGTEVTESEVKRLKSEFPSDCEIILANGNKV